VELKPCAKAEGALRMRSAATVRTEENRDRTWSASLFVNFITLMLVVSFVVGGRRRITRTQLAPRHGAKMYVIHKMQVSPC